MNKTQQKSTSLRSSLINPFLKKCLDSRTEVKPDRGLSFEHLLVPGTPQRSLCAARRHFFYLFLFLVSYHVLFFFLSYLSSHKYKQNNNDQRIVSPGVCVCKCMCAVCVCVCVCGCVCVCVCVTSTPLTLTLTLILFFL